MHTTTQFGLPLLSTGQSHKEQTVNEALIRIDALLSRTARASDISTPPESPADGDTYILSQTPTGVWEDHNNEIAIFYDGWHFIRPPRRFSMWVEKESNFIQFDGDAWKLVTQE